MTTTLPPAAMTERLRLAGVREILTVADPGYPAALDGFNLAVRHRPDVVVIPRSVADVAAAITVADEHDLPVTVIGLGHGALTPIEGGLAVVTRGMAGVDVDPVARTARVRAGTTWAEVLAAATPHGLAPLCGSAPGVGVMGYLLGGGLSPVARTFGFAADHVRSLTVVVADGSVLQVDADTHPDLFWALRGGKSGFGVVVEATIDLFPVARLVGGGLFFPAEDAAAVLATFASWSAGLPETVTTSIALLRLPPLPELPEPIRGRFVVHLRVAVVDDDPERAAEILAPMRAAGRPLLDTVAEMPFAAIGSVHADPVDPMPVVEGGISLRTFDEEAAAALLAAAGPQAEVPLAAVEVRLLGGALARPPAVPNAVGGRDAGYGLHVVGAPVPELFPVVRTVIDGVFSAVEPWRGTGSLVNFFGSANDPAAWENCWPADVVQRLREIRATYDPQARFRPATQR